MELPGAGLGREVALGIGKGEAYLDEFGRLNIVPYALIIDLMVAVIWCKGMFFHEITWKFCVLSRKVCTMATML